jgi:hypothetical protein
MMPLSGATERPVGTLALSYFDPGQLPDASLLGPDKFPASQAAIPINQRLVR